jgi:hypothetical protein
MKKEMTEREVPKATRFWIQTIEGYLRRLEEKIASLRAKNEDLRNKKMTHEEKLRSLHSFEQEIQLDNEVLKTLGHVGNSLFFLLHSFPPSVGERNEIQQSYTDSRIWIQTKEYY